MCLIPTDFQKSSLPQIKKHFHSFAPAVRSFSLFASFLGLFLFLCSYTVCGSLMVWHVRFRDPMDRSTPGFPIHHQLPELLKLVHIESVMPSNHLILGRPLLPLYRNQYWHSYPCLRRSCVTWTIKAPVWYAVRYKQTMLQFSRGLRTSYGQAHSLSREREVDRESERQTESQRVRETETDRDKTDRQIDASREQQRNREQDRIQVMHPVISWSPLPPEG